MKIYDSSENLIAVTVLAAEATCAGTHFLTPDSAELQLGSLDWKGGAECKAHTHISKEPRSIARTNEAYFVQRGSVMVGLYDNAGNELCNIRLGVGDVLLCLSGGHSFRAETDSRVIEIKQGPFNGSDKKMFDTAKNL